MPTLSELLQDPNYVNANAATKEAIFNKYAGQDEHYANANEATQGAIRDKWLSVAPQPKETPAPVAKAPAPKPEAKPEEAGVLRTLEDLGISGLKGIVGAGQTLIGQRKLLSTEKDPYLTAASPITALAEKALTAGERLAGYKEAPIEEQGKSLQQTQEQLQALKSAAQQQSEREVQQTKGFIPTVKALATHPRALAGAVAESIPSIAESALFARGLGATGLGALPRAAAGEGLVSAGQTAEQAAEQSGTLSPQQKATSVVSGVLTSALSGLGGKVANKLGVQDIDVLLAGGAPAAEKQSILKAAIKDAISESAFEELPQSMQEQIAANINAGKPWNEGVVEAGASGAMAALVLGGVGGGYGQYRANKSVAQAKAAEAPKEVIPAKEAERATKINQYVKMGHTQDNAEALADQSIREAQETANVQPTGRTDAGPDNTGLPVPSVSGGNAPGLDVAPTTGLEGTPPVAKDVGVGTGPEPSALSPLEEKVAKIEALKPKLSEMSPQQLDDLITQAHDINQQLDIAAVRKHFGEEEAAKFAEMSKRQQDKWWENNATEEFERDSSAFKGIDDDELGEYRSAVTGFDIESAYDLGRSIALKLKDTSAPNYVGSPDYTAVKNAFQYAKDNGMDMQEVRKGIEDRAGEWGGRDAEELFGDLFKSMAAQSQPVQEEAAPETTAFLEAQGAQVSPRERAAAERLRQQQEEAAAEKAAAAEQTKKLEAERIARQAEAEGKLPPVDEEAEYARAKATLNAGIQQRLGITKNIAPEDEVSNKELLAALANVMYYHVKKGVTSAAEAIKRARKDLGARAMGISQKEFEQAFKDASDRVAKEAEQEVKGVKKQKAKTDRIEEKIKRSKKTYQDASDFMGEIGNLIKTRSFDEVKDILSVIMDTTDSKVLAGLMGALTTDQVTRLVGDKIPHLKEINMYMERMSVMRNKMLAGGADIATPWAAFTHKHKEAGSLLHDLMHYSTIANVDPTKFSNAAAAIAGDTILADLQNKINSAAGTREAAAYKGQYNERVKEINKVYKDWESLSKIENGEGQKIYALAKDHYKALFDLHRLILDERIAELRIPGEVADVNSPKGRLMAEIRKTYEGAKELGTYFPLMRYGQYWLSKGTGVNREFYMFESEFQRNLAYVKRIRDMQRAGDPRTKKQIMESGEFNIGNNLTALRENSTEASDLLKAIFGEIDKTGVSDKEALKDQIYQMYLMTMPEQSFRKQFIHRKETTGFNPDALRNFVRSVYNNANQLSRLKYGSKVMQEMGSARDSLLGLADNTKINHETILDEIDRRVMAEVAPKFEDGLGEATASLTNKVAFMYLLSAPKTALNNMTAIPIYGIPVLTAEFGPTAATTLPKYMNIFNQIVNTKKNADGSVTWKPMSVGHMPFVMKDPVLSAAFEEAAERGVTDITRTYDMLSAGKTPSETYQGLARRGTRAVVQMLGFMFHHSERLNREVMYMTAFDLAYKQAVKNGMEAGVGKEAFEHAVKKAVDVVYESMFNYTRYNRPRYMRSAPARVLLQFKLYPQQVTAYYIRNFYSMLPLIEGNEAKKEAATKFFGTMMMTGLFSGLTGLFLYSTIMGVLQGLRNLYRDKKDEPVYVNEKDLDTWFRYEYLPEVLGSDMARLVEKGAVNYYAGADVATGTSANNLWFRDGKPDATFAGTVDNWLFANSGPGVSLFSNTMGALDDFENGNMEDGYAKLAPNLIKNPIIAHKWSKEGILTKQRAPIFDEDEVTKGMLFAKSIGYNPSKVAFLQERNFKYAAIQAEVLAERETLLKQYTNALDKDDEELVDKVEEAIDKFNEAVPREERISATTKMDARESAKERIRKAQQGLQLKPGFRREFSDAIDNTEQNP